jgi:large subunit ribosomal protein L29
MELAKIRSLSDEELKNQGMADAEQLFRLRFQVSLGQNDGVKKLRQLRKEIAQIKTVSRERDLSIRGAVKDATPAAAPKAAPVKAAKKAAKVKTEAKPKTEAKTKTAKKGAAK